MAAAVKYGGTIPGELISLQSDHREPSTEPSANLVGIGRGQRFEESFIRFCAWFGIPAFRAGWQRIR